MPLVHAHYDPARFHEPANLSIACGELVPAVLNCRDGRLTPGSIEFYPCPKGPNDVMHTDVLIDVEAYHYDSRARDLDFRTEQLRTALRGLFPDTTFAVWIKLVTAGWSSDVPDPDFDGDMSMSAAMGRVDFLLTEIRTTS